MQKYHDGIYTGMLLSGKLNAHLEEIDRSANEMFDLLVKKHTACDGVSETLKVSDQMTWVGQMNEIKSRAVEVVLTELIYV